jgi:EAL domain-containing protein (putative c-di-GMP-specific phosphodiesterase class I)
MTVGTENNQRSIATSVWALSGLFPGDSNISRAVVTTSPCSIGRSSECDLVLRSKKVSKRHAELITTDTVAIVKDTSSTNGTFVNGSRIHAPTPVGTRDLIQFADVELCVIRDFTQSLHDSQDAEGKRSGNANAANSQATKHRTNVAFQAIVRACDRTVYGYDALLQPDVTALESTSSLFDTVTGFGNELVLSRLVREEATERFRSTDPSKALFLNSDLSEQLNQDMIKSLARLRAVAGQRLLVLQIHEQAILDVSQLRTFAAALRVLNIQLAIIDVGIGQSRLQELAQTQPNYLKFPSELVKGLGTSDDIHFNLVRNLHQIASDLGITTIADGVDSRETADACRDIGFHLLEGTTTLPEP